MGVFRNAVKRKTHKERAQPLARKQYGLLEKKKDYRLRSRDFHRKEDHLKLLRRKAEEKNPDEFYFAMENAATKDGVHTLATAEQGKYTQEELRLMKTQDLKYIALKAQTEAKKIEQLQQRLHLVDEPAQSTHIVFEEPDARNDTSDSDADLERNDSACDQRDTSVRPETEGRVLDPDTLANITRSRKTSYKQLEERKLRHNRLMQMVEEMQLRKELMGKGGSKKIVPKQPGEKPIFKWNLVRKK